MLEIVCSLYWYLYVSSEDPLNITPLPNVSIAVSIYVHGGSIRVASSVNLITHISVNLPYFESRPDVRSWLFKEQFYSRVEEQDCYLVPVYSVFSQYTAMFFRPSVLFRTIFQSLLSY